MQAYGILLAAALALAACEAPKGGDGPGGESAEADGSPGWQMNDGDLHLVGADGKALLIIACADAPARLIAVAPSFKPIGSEDRFALGLGDEPLTLVADPTRLGDLGVHADAPIPGDLPALFAKAGEISALYGTQRVGPVNAPPLGLVTAFTDACAALAGR